MRALVAVVLCCEAISVASPSMHLADPATIPLPPPSPAPPRRPLLHNGRHVPMASPLPRFDELAVDVTTPFILQGSVFEHSVLNRTRHNEWEEWADDLACLWNDSPVANYCPFGLLEPRSYILDAASGGYVSSQPAHFRSAMRDLFATAKGGRPPVDSYLFQPLTPSRWNRLVARGDVPSTKDSPSLPAMLRSSAALEEARCFEDPDLAVEWHYKTDWRTLSTPTAHSMPRRSSPGACPHASLCSILITYA